MCFDAAYQGHFELLQWAREQGCPWDADEVSRLAAEGGHVEIVRWVKSQGSKVKPWWFIPLVPSCAWAGIAALMALLVLLIHRWQSLYSLYSSYTDIAKVLDQE
jgi:hypothetical protein